ncbi:MAG: hypothetical protein KC503_36800 [Myxococcales bacterium]|nr:hypothetical protein [Myxococcales bacterium]
MNAPIRTRLAPLRAGYTRTLELPDLEVTWSCSLDERGRVREIFARLGRCGDLERGLVDGLCIALSVALQHDVPIGAVLSKFRHSRFGPDGLTGDADIPRVSSVLDHLAQWLELVEARCSPPRSADTPPAPTLDGVGAQP